VPLFFQTVAPPNRSQGVKPYTALQLAGRDVYMREGCYNCHSQMIRPFRAETERYGHYSVAGESVYDHPFQWGSKRTGPDLRRVGGKYSDEWHRLHLINPRDLVPESNMPAYPWLAKDLRRRAGLAEPHEGAAHRWVCPTPTTEIGKRRRGGEGQDRDGSPDRLPAGARAPRLSEESETWTSTLLRTVITVAPLRLRSSASLCVGMDPAAAPRRFDEAAAPAVRAG
jgi:hypothetical protein